MVSVGWVVPRSEFLLENQRCWILLLWIPLHRKIEHLGFT